MNPKIAGYWAATGLFVFALGASGVMDLVLPPMLAESMQHLGYPDYFARILGVWKVLGVLALLAPGTRRLKEWAYAGFFFDLSGAAASHLISGDGMGGAGAPLVLLLLGAASWALVDARAGAWSAGLRDATPAPAT
ncbi:MAG: DoxX family protein [Alphaproteobacteria bacterium]|nr:DoxX family protein [Alphaproteobacteria bacterium]MCB9697217.1 DoxX family protein [Alphaproteobacteria bacterium]